MEATTSEEIGASLIGFTVTVNVSASLSTPSLTTTRHDSAPFQSSSRAENVISLPLLTTQLILGVSSCGRHRKFKALLSVSGSVAVTVIVVVEPSSKEISPIGFKTGGSANTKPTNSPVYKIVNIFLF